MEICYLVKSFPGGTCGFSYREDQAIPLRDCLKDISSHSRSCKFSDPENKVDLVLSRAGIFETPKDIDDFTNYKLPTDKISVFGGIVVPIAGEGCQKKCPTVVKVGLSRFQKLMGELASVYHR